jgi:hypothetical protein
MRSATISRLIYRSILRLHPRAFRERFSKEMLWIFDEEFRHKGAFQMLRDGAISLMRQHAKNDGDSYENSPTGIGCRIVTSGISPTRLIQAGFVASILFLAFVFALGRSSKLLPLAPSSKEAHSVPRRLHAPVRIEHLNR